MRKEGKVRGGGGGKERRGSGNHKMMGKRERGREKCGGRKGKCTGERKGFRYMGKFGESLRGKRLEREVGNDKGREIAGRYLGKDTPKKKQGEG